MGDRVISASELARHSSADDAWVAVEGVVMNVTKFAKVHPGGAKILLREAGKDASAKFKAFHKPSILDKYAKKLGVGRLEGSAAAAPAAAAAAAAALVPLSAKSKPLDARSYKPFGNALPYAEPSWARGAPSPYYSPSHAEWRARCRDFFDRELAPHVGQWDEDYQVAPDFHRKMAAAGLLAGVVGPWPTGYTDAQAPDGWDLFHESILIDEVCRAGSGGAVWSVFGGLSIGLPPVLQHGSEAMKRRVAPPCLRGEKFICLAITEPSHGSDVAGIQTTARLTPDGRHYIVNGAKKWITNGVFADYFTVLVRTGADGVGGISFLLLERGMPGLATKHMKCMGVWASGTTYITMEDVKVPVENLIGKEGKGFYYAMGNFSHERWAISVQAQRFARVCLEEAFAYALKRKTFGKPLVEHQVIRAKIAEMARRVESSQAWLDQLTFEWCSMPHERALDALSGPVALLKAHTSEVFEFCAKEAAQIFGGAAYVRGGQGEKVARLYREVLAYKIPAGSFEIMQEYGVKQAMRGASRASKL